MPETKIPKGLDLIKPTIVSLATEKKRTNTEHKKDYFLDKIKKTPESLLRAQTLEMPNDLVKPELSKNARVILKKRYLIRDTNGKATETAQDLYWRVASNISQADKLYDKNAKIIESAKKFYNLMAQAEFMPNSPCLRGAGREMQQLSACFVLPIEDSLESIITTLKHACFIFKTGGGCGYSFSRLRPQNDQISTTGNNAGGPVSFMRVYNAAIGEISQGGIRMGANMGMLRCDHPDIENFINAKSNMTAITNFNISVSATDDFMKAVEEGSDYDLINPRTGKIVESRNAREIFNKICENAWRNGDPGMIFIDRVNNSTSNPVKELGLVEATNPCGEQPLLPYESCVLGSINLSKFAKEGGMAWNQLREVIYTATHFLDNVIDMNIFIVPEIEQKTKGLRRIGLGVMGFADMLIKLGINYNSQPGVEMGEKVMEFINTEARAASQNLAKTRGAYPLFEKSDDFKRGDPALRNLARTTIAPTGTISVIADCSSGIEPIFALVHKRKSIWDKSGAKIELLVVDKNFEHIIKERGLDSQELMDEIAKTGSVAHSDKIPADIKNIFVVAHDLKPTDHIKIQAAFQKHTDNAISKTVNFPHSATVEDVKEAYLSSYRMGCKGITIYRDGSRDTQVLTVGSDQKPTETLVAPKVEPRERPDVVQGSTEKIATGMGNLFITINEDKEGLFEVFAQIGKSGGDAGALVEAIARLISIALRSRIPVDIIIEQLKGIRGSNPVWQNGELILSPPDALGKALERYLARQKELGLVFKQIKNQKSKIKNLFEKSSIKSTNLCPECGDILIYEEGCVKCPGCKLTKCG